MKVMSVFLVGLALIFFSACRSSSHSLSSEGDSTLQGRLPNYVYFRSVEIRLSHYVLEVCSSDEDDAFCVDALKDSQGNRIVMVRQDLKKAFSDEESKVIDDLIRAEKDREYLSNPPGWRGIEAYVRARDHFFDLEAAAPTGLSRVAKFYNDKYVFRSLGKTFKIWSDAVFGAYDEKTRLHISHVANIAVYLSFTRPYYEIARYCLPYKNGSSCSSDGIELGKLRYNY